MESRLGALLERAEKASVGPGAFLVTPATSAGAKRTASENRRVLEIQRRLYGRDPFFVSAAERKQLSAAFRAAAAAMQLETLLDAAHAVGRMLVELYRRHIDQGQNARGAMPALKRTTTKIKQAKGHGGRPVLVDTGELRDCLTYRVEQVR